MSLRHCRASPSQGRGGGARVRRVLYDAALPCKCDYEDMRKVESLSISRGDGRRCLSYLSRRGEEFDQG